MNKFLLITLSILLSAQNVYAEEIVKEEDITSKTETLLKPDLAKKLAAKKAAVHARMEAKRAEMGVEQAETLSSLKIVDTKIIKKPIDENNEQIVNMEKNITAVEEIPEKAEKVIVETDNILEDSEAKTETAVSAPENNEQEVENIDENSNNLEIGIELSDKDENTPSDDNSSALDELDELM